MRLCALLSSLLWLPLTGFAAPNTCDEVAGIAARETGVPLNILRAITRIETGRRQNGQAQPWPWTLNEGGNGRWFDTRHAAQSHLETALRQGVRNIDIGCFQINYHWHSRHFQSPASMLEPLQNARYAARHLKALYDSSGDWDAAAGRYHSATPELAVKYLARFRRELGQASTSAPALRNRGSGTPLLRGGQALSAGSLLRVTPGTTPFLRGAVPRLFGG